VNHYSAYEVLHLAQTCPDNPEVLHVDGERAILSVVRDDGRAAGPGELGRVVVTDLGNWVMPFINYDIGDWARAGPPCPCGRGFPTLLSLEGRLGEVIRTPAGKTVSAVALGAFLVYARGVLPYVWEFQAVQIGTDAVLLRIVPTARFTLEFARDLERHVEGFLAPGMSVRVETVDRIPSEASGKRLVITSAVGRPEIDQDPP
jgi:phenylacetate-CoA ligase